jgi:hypothetical protein
MMPIKFTFQVGSQVGLSGIAEVEPCSALINLGVDKTGHPYQGVTSSNRRSGSAMGHQL